jgi:hypothetical protein
MHIYITNTYGFIPFSYDNNNNKTMIFITIYKFIHPISFDNAYYFVLLTKPSIRYY